IEQSMELCERAWRKDSREDLVVLCTQGITSQFRKKEDAKLLRAFFERNRSRYEATSATTVAEAESLRRANGVDRKGSDEVAALIDRALKLDPHNVKALLAKASVPANSEHYKESFEI